ncbi:hypothetical protein K505DRAFT_357231 [Melanomma pulvis-pyrius CBS 109.77]|uniref:Lytic polysaccharide monooxygenase n=1 Tax=Melanomma pulvis-pyrius CBS 109.77 TaxID=1314802 RepID=A0A6A6XQR5_9PLEO|nr:hypothetical protein K505DRAFT_357231 [Melanomma pulvis-pyrius CBS 109.77]
MKLTSVILWGVALLPIYVHPFPFRISSVVEHTQPTSSSVLRKDKDNRHQQAHSSANLPANPTRARVSIGNVTSSAHPALKWAMSPLSKRYPIAGDAAWEDNMGKGCKLLSQMRASDSAAGQYFTPPKDSAASTFLKYPESFTDWGYSPETNGQLDFFDFEEGASPIRPALKALKIKDDLTESNAIIGWVHDRVTEHDGKTYKATGAKYYTIINVDAGS